MREIARPKPGKGEILVRVGAAGVTTADWRLRAAAFPGLISAVAGRLMFGLFPATQEGARQRFRRDRGVEVGPGVTEFADGDRVFGIHFGGAHAEYMPVKADGAVLKTPEGLSDTEAAAPPSVRCVRWSSSTDSRGEAGRTRADRRRIGRRRGLRGADRQGAGRGGDGCRLGRRAEFVMELGADRFVDYRETRPRPERAL
jgi:hypothetical protein